MPVPNFYDMMLPLLKLTKDNQEHKIKDLIEELAREFDLTEEEIHVLLPSGRDKLFRNRVYWARFYLTKAKLLDSPLRGHVRITQRGIDILNSNPQKIDKKFLYQFEEFKEFKESAKATESVSIKEEDELEDQKTPIEALESAYQTLKGELAQNLIDQVKTSTPDFFEKIVIDLLIKMGYGGSRDEVGKQVGKSHDEGIDGVIKEDKLGLDVIYIQAKKWENTVGRPEIQKFVGALEGKRAKKGIFLTTSNFSSEARDYISRINKKIVLIDGPLLARFMIDHDVGVSKIDSYDIKKIDFDYFEEE